MRTNTARTNKGSGGNGGSGAPLANARPPVASTTPAASEVFLTEDEVFDLFRLEGPARTPAALAHIPSCTVGGVRRYLREQCITWGALGGEAPRHQRGRAARREA